MSAIKPGKDLTTEALDMFWAAMSSWTIEDFRAAANHLAANCEFMPNPYHFNQLRKAAKPTAGEAWAKVLDAVRHSTYANGIDPLIDRAVRAIGGYRAVGMTTDDGLPFMERRFAEHFETIEDAESTRESVPQIAYTKRDTSSVVTQLTRGMK